MVTKPNRGDIDWDVTLNGALDDLQGQVSSASETANSAASSLGTLTSTVNGHTTSISNLNSSQGSQDTQITDLSGRVSSIETTIAGGAVNPRPWEIVVTSATDTAVQNAIAAALAAPVSSNVQKRIILGPGVYNLTTPLVAAGGTNTQYNNLVIQGAGMGTTTINWNNTTDAWIDTTNKRFRWLQIEGITFVGGSATTRWCYAFSTGSPFNQGWKINDCAFNGTWDYVIGLDGGASANLNSEMTLERIFTGTTSTWTTAFMVFGLSDVSAENQFLDYYINQCAFTISSGTLFKIQRGGAIHVNGGSWSAQSSSNNITFFQMTRGNSNNPTDNTLSVKGVRFEPKASTHVILNSAWADGHITFEHCTDVGSTQNAASYTHPRYQITDNNIWSGGVAPTVRFVNCTNGGFIQYTGTGAQHRGGVIVDGCKWYRGDTGQVANRVAADGADAILQVVSGTPRYDFRTGWNYLDLKSWNA